jgi:pimeloyl-ACP methyl ester carboxylesterase
MNMQKHLVWLVGVFLAACTLPSSLGIPATAVPTDVPVERATPTVEAASVPATTVTSLEWGTCTDEAVSDEDRDILECATLVVPLDYAQPDGETISLAIVRIPASTTRKGAILYNPGGPGGSGFEYVARGGQRYVDTLGLEAFDFVGFDPRGVDRSAGIRCQSDADLDKYMFPDTTPDTPEEEAFLTESRYAFSDACKAKYGDALQHYSTANTARDMDMIRMAMGDETISYLGVSYGTYLGAVYASMFPGSVRAMVLDSAYQPTGDTIEEQYLTQLQGFALAMNNWIDWCEAEAGCAFATGDVGKRWDALYAQYDANPVTAEDGRVANQEVVVLATISALYSESSWPELGVALNNAENGDTAGIWRLADAYNERDSDGTFATMQQSNSVINCASGLMYDPVTTGADALYAKMIAASPYFTKDLTVDDLETPADCSRYMPAASQPVLGYTGTAPILVVAGENDPATPLRWGNKMRDAMGSTARLITYTGEGHGQVLSSTCVSEYASDVLVKSSLPTVDVTCEPDPAVAKPAWWGELPQIDDGTALSSAIIMSALGFTESEVFLQAWAVDNNTPATLIDTYGYAFETMGYLPAGEARDVTGATLQYYMSGDNYVGLLIVDATTLQSEDWLSVQMMVPADKALILYLYFPE